MAQHLGSTSGGTLDQSEINRFDARADAWWDPNGEFRPLHRIGPARLTFIRDRMLAHFGTRKAGPRALAGLSVADIGCGGGLVAEPLARLGAVVTGVDPGAENIAAARRHAELAGVPVDYRVARAEDLAREVTRFDAVVCLEVLEHVPDPAALVTVLAQLARPGGLLILSTINRTLKAYALAIVGAEYILRWLPPGTHRWERFITPDELGRYAAAAGLGTPEFAGLVYDPIADRWSVGRDTDVNYMAALARPA